MAVGRGGATGISGRPGRGGFLAVSQAEQGSDRDDLSKPIQAPQSLGLLCGQEPPLHYTLLWRTGLVTPQHVGSSRTRA